MERGQGASKKEQKDLVNEMIRFPEMLVIDENGNALGIKSRNDALRIARDANSDAFIEILSAESMPVPFSQSLERAVLVNEEKVLASYKRLFSK